MPAGAQKENAMFSTRNAPALAPEFREVAPFGNPIDKRRA
jgi:hypothetical protein